MNQFRYNSYGRQQTGFDNSIDHSLFGHWRNPEYQGMCQDAEMIERDENERSYLIGNEFHEQDEQDNLPF